MSSYVGKSTALSWDLEDVDPEEIDESEYGYAGPDHLLFCIDASIKMQKPLPDTRDDDGYLVRGKSALHQTLEAVEVIQRHKVISGPKDSVAILCYNVDPLAESKSVGNYEPGTAIFSSLRTINAEEMKRLVELLRTAKEQYEAQGDDPDVETVEPEILKDTFPSIEEKREMNIANVLKTCNFLFRDGGTKLSGSKRVFVVTNDDLPSGSGLRAPARTNYSDLSTYGVTVIPFFIDRPENKFNPKLYWNDILGIHEEPSEDEQINADGLAKLADVMSDLAIKHAPKRVQYNVPLKLGGKEGDIVIGVCGYYMISPQNKGQPRYVTMRGQTVQEVQVRSQYTSAETGAVLADNEIGQAFQFGKESAVRNTLEPNWWENSDNGEGKELADDVLNKDLERRQREDVGEEVKEDGKDVVDRFMKKQRERAPKVVTRTRMEFSNEEVTQFRSLGLEPQIKIIGFQSPDHLRIQDNIKHASFIYPNEDTYTGSTRTFTALLQSCLKHNRHALALTRLRTNFTPEFAVLVPQEETFLDGRQDRAPGFHVIPLPFKDDIRAPPKNMIENLPATEDQVGLMASIVKRLRIKGGHYRPEVYTNPALAYHYKQLQALAFEEDWDPEDPENQNLDRTLPKYAGMHHSAGDYMKAFNAQVDDDERAVAVLSASRKRGKGGEDSGILEQDLTNVRGAWRAGTMNKLKIVELRDWAKFYEISLGGKSKKADIIEVLSDHFAKEEESEKQVKKSKT